MSSPNSLWNGFFVMVTGVILSVFLMVTLGQIGDKLITILIDVGLTDMNPDWASSFESVYTIQSFLFILCLMLGLEGVIIFILSSVRKQRYDTYENGTPQIDYTQGMRR